MEMVVVAVVHLLMLVWVVAVRLIFVNSSYWSSSLSSCSSHRFLHILCHRHLTTVVVAVVVVLLVLLLVVVLPPPVTPLRNHWETPSCSSFLHIDLHRYFHLRLSMSLFAGAVVGDGVVPRY